MRRERNPHVALLSGTLVASAVLVAPIILWTRFGDHDPLRTSAVVLAAMLGCAVAVRSATRRYADRLLVRTRTHHVATAAPCRSHDIHRAGSPRDRRHPSTRPCGPSRCRPRYTARGLRDAGCPAATPPLARRSTRRRTRP
jgi:hypothetical protein